MINGFLIEKNNFKYEEVNFPILREITNQVILEYTFNDDSYFRRSMFELYRLGFRIGIKLTYNNEDFNSYIKDLIKNIRGFDIVLGVWTDNILLSQYIKHNFSNSFISGIVIDANNIKDIPMNEYILAYKIDLPNANIITTDYTTEKGIKLPLGININTDFVSLYKENNLKKLDSTFMIK